MENTEVSILVDDTGRPIEDGEDNHFDAYPLQMISPNNRTSGK